MFYKSIFICFLLFPIWTIAQKTITGQVQNEAGDPLPGVNVFWENAQRGTTTDLNGMFSIGRNGGDSVLIFKMMGFETIKITAIHLSLNITMATAALSLDAMTVSSNRIVGSNKKSPVDVGVINDEMIESAGAVCLSESINFQSGVRLESDCQTCNYTQVRMNGLGGGYTQILVNSRPIFGSLIGLYGLEQYPTNWIERIEIIRGGGSAIYGSGAIGGVVNIIPKAPKNNYFNVGTQMRNINGQSWENNTKASMTLAQKKTAFSIFANRRQREEYDANGDGFSELPRILGHSIGAKAYFHPIESLTINVDALFLNEERNGGDQLNMVPHLREQAEQRTSNAFLTTLDMEYQLNDQHQLRFFGGGQWMDREHYTGFYQSEGYGVTDNQTFQLGVQYNWRIPTIFKKGKGLLTAGFEMKYDDILDQIEAYNYNIDQITRQTGTFLQFDWTIVPVLQLLTGARLNTHNFLDRAIVTPRAALRWTPVKNLQVKAGYSNGFRAPQAFDADLHIAFAGGGISRRLLDPNLKEETSNSYTASISYDIPKEKFIAGFTVSGFYTELQDAFIYEEVESPQTGELTLYKTNAQSAIVRGISLEAKANFNYWTTVTAGWTYQNNTYSKPVEWSNQVEAERSFLRTPNFYGFVMVTVMPEKPLSIDLNLVHTGSMLVPHYAGAPEIDDDELYMSKDFWNFSAKINYTLELKNDHHLKFFVGVNNIFNAYQTNFDSGPNRDSNFIYGPTNPRMYVFGLEWEMKKH